MATFLNLVIALSYLCVVHSQLILPDPVVTLTDANNFEMCEPVTRSITIIDAMPVGASNALQSTILSNVLDSSIYFAPDSCANIEFMVPCPFVVETVTYSPLVDILYPSEYLPIFDTYPVPYPDLIQNVFLAEAYPKVFYTETIKSFAPTVLSPSSSSPDLIDISDFLSPNFQAAPVPCVNGVDVVPINSIPSNSVGLIDLILPPQVFGGFNDLYFSPFYFDNFISY